MVNKCTNYYLKKIILCFFSVQTFYEDITEILSWNPHLFTSIHSLTRQLDPALLSLYILKVIDASFEMEWNMGLIPQCKWTTICSQGPGLSVSAHQRRCTGKGDISRQWFWPFCHCQSHFPSLILRFSKGNCKQRFKNCLSFPPYPATSNEMMFKNRLLEIKVFHKYVLQLLKQKM